MDSEVLTEANLTRLRAIGDPPVDELVAHVLAPDRPGGSERLQYNFMLDLADRILAAPSLRFVPDSHLNEALERLPAELRAYFSPAPAPPWVDADKLALGARLWQENMLAMLGVLYAYSLPACYLIGRGIPALYQTAKLREPRYLSQRIYETGLMLDAVMGPGGLRVVEDLAPETGSADRYLWGRGYVTAKKVRFLHASMRYMLTHSGYRPRETPTGDTTDTLVESFSRQAPAWDAAKLGAPVNQEDLAYTLLTFGYALPKGLAHWGCVISDEQRDAFLHLWKVVGHVMGIQDELLTDDWDEARRLMDAIASRQALHSEDGVALTEALLGFLGDYMPHFLGLSQRTAALMMIDQLGLEDAKKILRPELVRAATRADRRAIYATARLVIKLFYKLRFVVMRRMPVVSGVFSELLDGSGHELLESWRGAYVRRPFYVPADATTWQAEHGATAAFVEALKAWRRQLFDALGVSIALLFLAVFALAALVPAWLLGTHASLWGTAIVCAASGLGALAMMKWRLPAIFARRPTLPG